MLDNKRMGIITWGYFFCYSYLQVRNLSDYGTTVSGDMTYQMRVTVGGRF